MKVRLPRDGSSERVYSEIEKGFDRINEYSLPRAGGAAGQVLVKASARDFDYAWAGTGKLPLELRSGWVPYDAGWRAPSVSMDGDGLVTVSAIIKNGLIAQNTVIAILPSIEMAPSAFVGFFPCVLSASGRADGVVYVTSSGAILAGTTLDSTWTTMNFSYKAG